MTASKIVDQIDNYNRTGIHNRFRVPPFAYDFGGRPCIQRGIPGSNANVATYTINLPNRVPHIIYPSGPNVIAQITVQCPVRDIYVTTSPDLSRNYSAIIRRQVFTPIYPTTICTSRPLYLWSIGGANGVHVMIEQWGLDDDRLTHSTKHVDEWQGWCVS